MLEENITLGEISGWIVCKKKPIFEVRFLVNKQLIANTKVNIKRLDVIEFSKINKNHGFVLELPSNISFINSLKNIKIIALSIEGEKISELKYIFEPNKTKRLIRKVLKSNLIGSRGNVDGYQKDGAIHGWASRKGEHIPRYIWMHYKNNPPKSIKCDKYRDDMNCSDFINTCGFSVFPPPNNSKKWIKEVWFSFDFEGKFKLNSNKNNLPINNHEYLISNEKEFIKNKSDYDLHLDKLRKFKELLDNFEENMEKINRSKSLKFRKSKLFKN